MFAVLFEVYPKSDQWDAYLGYARMLKPEIERIDGFVDNVRYRSLTRDGWILSLSSWRDEKALVRWRTQVKHHGVQEKGRFEVFNDYHLRVGQLTQDTPPARRPCAHRTAAGRNRDRRGHRHHPDRRPPRAGMGEGVGAGHRGPLAGAGARRAGAGGVGRVRGGADAGRHHPC